MLLHTAPASYAVAVVVVGAGPTGLATANLLGRYGIRTLLVERNAETVQEPRAVSIDDESLRTMQAIGVVDTVLQKVVAGYGSEYYSSSGRLFLKVGPTEMPYGYPRRNAFRQPILERQLKDHLIGAASVDALFGWTVSGIEQDAAGVALDLDGPDGTKRRVTADYVVAADGASSPIRVMLDLKLDGETFQEQWLIVDLETSRTASPETMVFCNPLRPCIALPGPDETRRFEFKLVGGDDPATMESDETVWRLLRAHGVAPESRVTRKAVYTFHARLASRWSKGRVFLAGDACHLTPPFAGQGMNSGIRDAHNLAWKLAWVASGKLPRSILESYERERRDHVAEMIRLSLRMGRIMGPRNELTGLLTQSVFRVLGLWPWLRDYFAQMKYKPAPRFKQGMLVPDDRPRWRTSVGRLLPQTRVGTASGPMLLDDVLGDGFALVGFTDDLDEFRSASRHAGFAALAPKRVLVTSGSDALGENQCVDVVHDTDGALAASLDATPGRVFLVRPDRYVLGAFALGQVDDFVERLASVIAAPVTPIIPRSVSTDIESTSLHSP